MLSPKIKQPYIQVLKQRETIVTNIPFLKEK